MPRIEDLSNNWRSGVRRFLCSHPDQAAIVSRLDVAAVVDREREKYITAYRTCVEQSSLLAYRLLNPDHQIADYLTHSLCYFSRRLLSRFRV